LNQRIDDVAEELHEVAALQNRFSQPGKTAMAKSATASSKSLDEDVDVAEKKPSAEAIVKAASNNKVVKNITAGQTQAASVSETVAKSQNNGKPVNKTSVTPKKGSETTDLPANDINNVINSARQPAVNTTRPQTGSGGWTVNLGSSNQLEEAKKTANSFTQKGIPVTISSVTVKNKTRYRLQVKGFKSKEEATAYANKAKDTLKINSVWINP
jgi:cell division septation protein DedD